MGATENTEQQITDQSRLIGDEAKLSIADDEFGLEQMVVAIAKGLVYSTPENGYVLGVEGRWGSGKSSFANFLVEEIRKRAPHHKVIRFDPWLIGDKNALIGFYFGQFASGLDELKERSTSWAQKRMMGKLANKVRQYGQYAGTLAAPIASLAPADPTGSLAAAAVGVKTVGSVSKVLQKPPLDQLRGEITSELKTLRDTGERWRIQPRN